MMLRKAELTAREHDERVAAGRASAAHRHKAETAPSVRQGGGSAPSRAAVGLFRQGQARRDTSSPGRAAFDTRSGEPQAGQIHASLTLHFPKAYRSATPDKAVKTKSMARALGTKDSAGNRVVQNPETFDAAMRHAPMRAVVHAALSVVRDHQAGTIEKAMTGQRGPAMIPAGTPRGVVVTAYKHASLLALHKAGLVDYHFDAMDAHTKRDLRPLSGFMRYASRRVFDQLNVHPDLKGKWGAFRDEFGHEFADKRTDATGKIRRRMRPNHELIKIDGDPDDLLKKTWHSVSQAMGLPAPGAVPGINPAIGANLSRWAQQRVGIARSEKQRGSVTHKILTQAQQHERKMAGKDEKLAAQQHKQEPLPGTGASVRGLGLDLTNTMGAHRGTPMAQGLAPATQGSLKMPGASFSQGSAVHATGGAPRMSFGAGAQRGLQLPHTPVAGTGAVSTPMGPGSGVPGQRKLRMPAFGKVEQAEALAKSFGSSMSLGFDANTNPSTQLHRAMHPRLRRLHIGLRLNANRGLRHQLNGGVTRTERWQLGLGKSFGSVIGRAGSAIGHAAFRTPKRAAVTGAAATVGGAIGAVKAKQAWDDSPTFRAGVGAAAGTGLAYALSRGRIRRVASLSAKTLGSAANEAVHDAVGHGTAPPHVIEAAARIKRATLKIAAQKRRVALAAKPKLTTLAQGAAAGGAGTLLATGRRNDADADTNPED